MLQTLQETVSWLRPQIPEDTKIGIILGTGLGDLASNITDKKEIPYEKIPNFPVSTVTGHHGNLIVGELGGKPVLAMQGRFHFYEGYDMKQVTYPVRVMQLLGIKYL
ncbi:MAG: purine-nucleoside phosphorylase, partial [Dysgonamonadaceae bacterium]|nr:purine-nucleoside phosphorylase [Dysgonamonadaceae bacterium]